MVVGCVGRAVLFLLLLSSAVSSELLEGPELEKVENALLSALGMNSRPRPKRRDTVHIPKYMMDLYLEQSGHNFKRSNKYVANIARSYTHKESPVDLKYPDNRFHLRFDVNNFDRDDTLQAAELKLQRTKVSAADSSIKVRVLIHDVIKPPKKQQSAILRLLDSKVVQLTEDGVITSDVTPAVQRWVQDQKQNHGLFVTVLPQNRTEDLSGHYKQHVRLRRSLDRYSDQQWLDHQPVLLAFSEDAHSRPKRSKHSRRRRKRRRDTCRRHKLYVDFEDVGWNDWIVAPPGYDAYFCQGRCPFPLPDNYNTTNHAIVQTLVNSHRMHAVPPACCVPTELSPISILYLDTYDKVVLRNYKEMVVEGCGCR